MNLPELALRYENGEPMRVLAAEVHMRHGRFRKLLEAAGATIRDRGPRPTRPPDHEPLGTPPQPRLCVHDCGRMAQSRTATSCVPCALAPPCTCAKPIPGAKYNSEDSCRRCGRLIAERRR